MGGPQAGIQAHTPQPQPVRPAGEPPPLPLEAEMVLEVQIPGNPIPVNGSPADLRAYRGLLEGELNGTGGRPAPEAARATWLRDAIRLVDQALVGH